MDVIRLLPDSVANQIAAGEVIQRPASVIKELVENAADAGATDIKIFIKDAGKTLIQVVDNGKGMSETDARMAFERHATSKIKSAEDLFSLHTMGFRGEALPSICAISQVELRTRTEDAQMGTRLLINGSAVESQEPCMCEKGTSISIRNLFYNLPARRKFLKSDAGELGHIMREFERMALVNNNLRISIDTGSRVVDLRPGSMLQRINDIWKNNLNMQLIPIDVDTDLVKIQGYVSRPEFARRRNALWHLIANGRHINHLKMHKVITGCFENLIATDTQPCYFFKIQVDPSEIDINIHPSKNEVKLEREKEILSILGASIKAALGKFAATPQIDFDTDLVPVQSPKEGAPENPEIQVPPDYNPFDIPSGTEFIMPQDNGSHAGNDYESPFGSNHYTNNYYKSAKQGNVRNWDTLYNRFMNRQEESARDKMPVEGVLPAIDENPRLPGMYCFQYADKYIVTSTRGGVMIVDQHRAHLKILFEDCLRNVKRMEVTSQRILFPESISLDFDQQDALARVQTELAALGFSLEYEEGNKWQIAAVPSMISQSNAKETVLRILESVMEDSDNYCTTPNPVDDMMERMALVMAKSAAITRGRKLSASEMENLIGQLMSLPDPSLTPSGKLIFTILDEDRLKSMLY
ncbi:MAG: DNA mismatch repair endonuclease MutL [Muribaculaceae bacterium]|nr:DNA mismatch repair endonuclease MutL [Muribaculaceae bacterium]